MLSNSEQPLYIYIMGRGHSGTTILELLLNRSANLAAMGEVDKLGLQTYRDERTRWIGQCSCGERPQNCPLWGRIIKYIEDSQQVDFIREPFTWRISDVGLEEEYGWQKPFPSIWHAGHRLIRTIAYHGRGSNAGPFTRIYQNWVQNRDKVAGLYAAQQNVIGVVDSSKDPLQMRDIVAHSSLPVKILFLTRDVRGLAWSAVRTGRWTAQTEAMDWARLNSQMLRCLGGIDRNQWIHVRYENLCSNTDSELSRIHNFLQIDRQAQLPAQERIRRHTIAGNRVRFRDLEEIREDCAWRDNLTTTQLEAVVNAAGSVAEQLGYSL